VEGFSMTMTRGGWRAEWRMAEHENSVREALHLGNPYEALARGSGALRAEVVHRRRRNSNAAQLIAVRLSADQLVTANSLYSLTPAGPRGDLSPEVLIQVFDRALADAVQDQEGTRHGSAH
jgi:hypothetical protein